LKVREDGAAGARILRRYGHIVDQHRLLFLIIPVITCLLTVPFALQVTGRLSTSGWLPDSAESVQVTTLLQDEFGRDTTSHFLLFRDAAGSLLATDDAFRQEVARVVAPLHSNPRVQAIYTWGSTTNATLNASLISDDGSMSIAVVVLDGRGQEATRAFDQFRSQIHSDRLNVDVGGWSATGAAFGDLTQSDLLHSEKLALPATMLLLFLVFGGVIAAGLPIALAVLALLPSMAGIFLLSHLMETSLFAVNTVSMLGLALGIDYSLIMVTRFREELEQSDAETALSQTLATAGETIVVSGLAVMVGLLGLIAFQVPAAVSTGISAAIVVFLSVILAMTALPAALSLTASRIRSRRHFSLPRLQLRSLARLIQQHPAIASLLSIAIVVLLTLPALNMRGAAASMTVLPQTQEARQVYDTVQADFSKTTLSPIVIVVTPKAGRMTSTKNLTELQRFQTALGELDGVQSVETVWSFLPRGTTANILSTSLLLDPTIKQVSRPYLTDNAAVIEITPIGGPSDAETMNLVRTIRETGYGLSGGTFRMLVGSETGTNVDLVEYVKSRTPLTIAIVVSLMWGALFLRFRSVVLPTKAVLLNLLSLGASFGALVWIFQDGHFAHLLGFEPLGYTILLVPIVMFCFMSGLSMDYEVVMLSRIKEAWDETNDNDLAIEQGLAASARLVTSAALIMLVIFIAFSTSELQFIKQIGVGLAIAVVLDTTLIRLILLPSTMRLFGKWNWWSPWNSV
jgi:RND superfamily putative drug exporter